MSSNRILLCLLLATVLAGACSRRPGKDVAEESAAMRELPPIGFFAEDFFADTTAVKDGENPTSLLLRLGLDTKQAYGLLAAGDSVFDSRKMIAGKRVVAYYSADSLRVPEYIVYSNDRIRSTVFKCRDSIAVWTYDKPVVRERKSADVTVNSSLWNDMLAGGYSPLLISELADIYAWSVNFFTLQKGDRFRVIYQQSLVDDEVVSIDTIYFGVFDSDVTKQVAAIRFDQGDGGNKYWNEKGESLKKAFLKAPLKYNRISSRFSYRRKHPVTGKIKAHTAVDYAAPTGTPVQSIGDGVVTLIGWDGTGGGNRVKIKHMNGYETCYMHLSKFASGLKKGSRVSQGQTIGYVGATGTATGPHLDFRVWKDGTPVDPLKMISPPSEPIRKENLDTLKALYDNYMLELEGIAE